MTIKVNGKAHTLEGEISLAQLLSQKQLNADRVVIEHNCRIVEKKDLAGIIIKEEDSIEIVSFVGGG